MASNYKSWSISNIPDFKDEFGLWVKSSALVRDEFIYSYVTRSATVWSYLINRTTHPSRPEHKPKRIEYAESLNLFEDYQHFAEWSQAQRGYMNRDDNGKFWHLDKDILVRGNKNYSADNCCYVSNHVNNLFAPGLSGNSGLPLGVSMHSREKHLYVAQCQKYQDPNNGYIGRFETAALAHKAWQAEKIRQIKYHADNVLLGDNVRKALVVRAAAMQDDLENGRQTFYQ